MPDDVIFSTDHQAVSAFKPEYTTAGTTIDVVNAAGLERVGAHLIIAIIAVAPIDNDIAG